MVVHLDRGGVVPCSGAQSVEDWRKVGLPLVAGIRQDVTVATPGQQSWDIPSTLTPNGAKARFGASYLHAICSQAGVEFRETTIDTDVLAVDGDVVFEAASARVQVKCTGRLRIDGHSASCPTEPGWWTKWHRAKCPVYLVLVIVDPDDQQRWLEHRDDGTLHRAAAFWARVDHMPAVSTIVIPKDQRLTADTLREWAGDVDAGYMPQKTGDGDGD